MLSPRINTLPEETLAGPSYLPPPAPPAPAPPKGPPKNGAGTRATIEQKAQLEAEFERNPNPSVEERKEIAKRCNRTPKQVTNWFQARRAQNTTKRLSAAYRSVSADPNDEEEKLLFPALVGKIQRMRDLFKLKPAVTDDYACKIWTPHLGITDADMLGWLHFQRNRQAQGLSTEEVGRQGTSRVEHRSESVEAEREALVDNHRHPHLPTPFSVSPEPEPPVDVSFDAKLPTQFPNSPLSPQVALYPELSSVPIRRSISRDTSFDIDVKNEYDFSPRHTGSTYLPSPTSAHPFFPTTSDPTGTNQAPPSTFHTAPTTRRSASPVQTSRFSRDSFISHVRGMHPQGRPSFSRMDTDPSTALATYGETSKQLLIDGKALQYPNF